MRKRSISLIIGLMGCALLGVMAMQLYFLSQTYHLQSQLFDGQVDQALENVVSNIARKDANNFIVTRARYTQSSYVKVSESNGVSHRFVSKKSFIRDSLKNISRKLAAELADPGQQGSVNIRLRFVNYVDELGIEHQQMVPEVVNTPLTPNLKGQKLHQYDTISYVYPDPQLGNQIVYVKKENPLWKAQQEHKHKERQYRGIMKLLEQDSLQNIKQGTSHSIFAGLANEYQKMNEPLKQRLNLLMIDSLLRFELHNKGIDLPFDYQVTNANNDSLIFTNALNTNGDKPQFIKTDYRKPIFGKEVLNDRGMIWVKFQHKNSLIISNMTFSMGTSAGLLIVLILCFGYTIFSILKQKKISEMKTDFINNMTHEFKTPVSTIMIASEALNDEEVMNDKGRISRLAGIIYEENARLGSHIERVLNIARIEKNDFRLDIKPIEVNELITTVLDSMTLKLQKYGAQTTLHLDAPYDVIAADELHFSNVLYNLIDNAIKYSHNPPQITISTITVKNELVITIADKGIGMSRDQQSRIFEQFYRVPTGNLHDVKGFGLGLSYVNTVVKRLNGAISVHSEKDKGSEFELRFTVA